MRINKILWLIPIVFLSISCNISQSTENAIEENFSDENVIDENATQVEILYEEDFEKRLKRVVQEKTEQPIFCTL